MNVLRMLAEQLLKAADVRIDGGRPWDIRVHDPVLFRSVAMGGSIALGEAYMDGAWTCDDLEELAFRLGTARLERVAEVLPAGLMAALRARLFNQQTRARSMRVARAHYDLDDELFAAFLGRYRNYSCAYFRRTNDLDEAQRDKMDLVCRKLDLRPGEHLLDVGGGWGEFARHAACEFGARVTSINISERQLHYARERCRGLSVEVVRSDYRDVRGSFDKIAAIAMFTHVGARNYRTFMRAMHRLLKPHGVLLVEGVWGNVSTSRIDAWTDKYIFPGAMLPSGAQTFRAIEGLFVAEDLHNFGPDYLKTLREWNARFQAAWPRLSARFDERIRRMFEYFFCVVAGFFRARALQHWHLVLTRTGAPQPSTWQTWRWAQGPEEASGELQRTLTPKELVVGVPHML
jgi:cyclopropane-fatty-acyl-phospholipid synthase